LRRRATEPPLEDVRAGEAGDVGALKTRSLVKPRMQVMMKSEPEEEVRPTAVCCMAVVENIVQDEMH